MSLFQDKSGKWHEKRPHLATFNGKHNRDKSKTLITLMDNAHKGGTGLGVKELHALSGVSYDYLKAKLTWWFRWKYVSRSAVDPGQGKPVFVYRIAERGSHFVNDIIPRAKFSEYVREINEFRRSQHN